MSPRLCHELQNKHLSLKQTSQPWGQCLYGLTDDEKISDYDQATRFLSHKGSSRIAWSKFCKSFSKTSDWSAMGESLHCLLDHLRNEQLFKNIRLISLLNRWWKGSLCLRHLAYQPWGCPCIAKMMIQSSHLFTNNRVILYSVSYL